MLPLFSLLTPVHIVDYGEHIEAVAPQVEHLQVRLDLILGFLPERHLLLDPLAECTELIVVVVVGLLPEHAKETSLALFPLLLPILGINEFK